MKKKLTMVAALVLVFALGVTGTLAYLTAKTDAITNTFTVGNVKIELAETKTNFKMVPGQDIDKDPKVTVKAGSEACWLFVKVEKSSTLDTYISYGVADGWTALTGVDGVYYRQVASSTADATYSVLTGDKVAVKTSVTQPLMDALSAQNAVQPTLTFTAYAIQQAGFDTAAAAWTEVSK